MRTFADIACFETETNPLKNSYEKEQENWFFQQQ